MGDQLCGTFEEQERVGNLVLCVVDPIPVRRVFGRRDRHVPDISKIEEIIRGVDLVQLYVDANIVPA